MTEDEGAEWLERFPMEDPEENQVLGVARIKYKSCLFGDRDALMIGVQGVLIGIEVPYPVSYFMVIDREYISTMIYQLQTMAGSSGWGNMRREEGR